MARIRIPFLGMSSTPAHKDGECKTLINLRPKNGVKKPVAPRKVLQTLSQDYDIVFLHRGADYGNWIGVKNKSIYTNIRQTPVLLSTTNENVNSIQQIGNTLSVVTSENVYYLLWKDNEYLFLGKLPELPHATFNCATTSIECEITAVYTEETWISSNKSIIYKLMDLFINGGKLTTSAQGGEKTYTYAAKGQHLFDAHILRYAFRLYDNSLIHYSAPVLLMPDCHILEMKRLIMNDGSSGIPRIRVSGYRPTLFINTSNIPSTWVNIIKSVDFFLSPPIGISNIENIRPRPAHNSSGSYDDINFIEQITAENISHLQSDIPPDFVNAPPKLFFLFLRFE